MSSNNPSLVRTVPRATVTLTPNQFEGLVVEFCGRVLVAEGVDEDEYTAEFTSASDVAQFGVALRGFTR